MTDPLDAQERATRIAHMMLTDVEDDPGVMRTNIVEQIRQAEQAAREKALEEAINVVDECGEPCNGCKDGIYALKEKP